MSSPVAIARASLTVLCSLMTEVFFLVADMFLPLESEVTEGLALLRGLMPNLPLVVMLEHIRTTRLLTSLLLDMLLMCLMS